MYMQICNQSQVQRVTFEEVSKWLNVMYLSFSSSDTVSKIQNISKIFYICRNTSMKAYVEIPPEQNISFSLLKMKLNDLEFHI